MGNWTNKVNWLVVGLIVGSTSLVIAQAENPDSLMIGGSGPHYVKQGKLGIGKTNPSATLDVNGSAVISGKLTVGGNTFTQGNALVNGKVGIGTLVPSAQLQVVGFGSDPVGGGPNPCAPKQWYDENGNNVVDPKECKSTRLTVKPGTSANPYPGVGIATADPDSNTLLQIGDRSSDFSQRYLTLASSTGNLVFANGGSLPYGGPVIYAESYLGSGIPPADINFWLSDSKCTGCNQAVLSLKGGSGNVGIGTQQPQSKLEVASSGYFQFSKTSAGLPPVSDCDNDAKRGRMSIDTANNRLYICNGAARGWDYIPLTN